MDKYYSKTHEWVKTDGEEVGEVEEKTAEETEETEQNEE